MGRQGLVRDQADWVQCGTGVVQNQDSNQQTDQGLGRHTEGIIAIAFLLKEGNAFLAFLGVIHL